MNEQSAAVLRRWIASDPAVSTGTLEAGTDARLAIGQDVWRLRWHGQVTTAVGSNADLHTTCGAILDALAILETDAHPDLDRSIVNVMVDRPPPSHDLSETDQAVRSIRDAVTGVRVRVWYRREDWLEDVGSAPVWPTLDDQVAGWVRDLLVPRLTAEPHDFALSLVGRVGDPSLHLYPSEIRRRSEEVWALRIDGLEIGTVGPAAATLRVGRPGKWGDGPQRAEFIRVFGRPDVTVVEQPTSDDALDLDAAADKIRELIRRFRGGDVHGSPITHRTTSNGTALVDEHALEARLLNGLVQLEHTRNALVRNDHRVARGSQFPTLWGRGGRARYLDALVTDGTTPIAVELKVGTGGQGRYYRRSLVQAVLYRHFITHADDLEPWFDAAGLNRAATKAAIAVPIPTRWSDSFAAAHDLLTRVAGYLNVSVHLLDDRATPQRTHPSLPEPERATIETNSWRLAAALSHRRPISLGRTVELHDGGGQYDQIQLQPLADRSVTFPAPQPRISINRHGSVFVFSPLGTWRWVWRDIWAHLAAGGDIDSAADDLVHAAGLPPDTKSRVAFPELAARFLDLVDQPDDWSWRCAWKGGNDPATWAAPYRSALRRYSSRTDDSTLLTIARIWGANHNGTAPVIVDHDNLRVWMTTPNGCTELTNDDPYERIRQAAETAVR